MGRAFIALYAATAERAWLTQAERSAAFIEAYFRDSKQPGYLTSVESLGSKLKPATVIDENTLLARFTNALLRYTGNEQYRRSAEHAMRYLATEQIALSRLTQPGILQAAFELANDPTHITIVGAKTDPQAMALFSAALEFPAVYRRIEWWDRKERRLPNPDVEYPQLPHAAAFICADGACSLPIYEPGEIGNPAKQSGPADEVLSRRD